MTDTITTDTTNEELLKKIARLEWELEDMALEIKQLRQEASASWYREAYFGESSQ